MNMLGKFVKQHLKSVKVMKRMLKKSRGKKNDIQGILDDLVNRYAKESELIPTNDSSKEIKLFELSGRAT